MTVKELYDYIKPNIENDEDGEFGSQELVIKLEAFVPPILTVPSASTTNPFDEDASPAFPAQNTTLELDVGAANPT